MIERQSLGSGDAQRRIRTTSPEGKSQTVSVRLPLELIKEVDELAKRNKRARASEIWVAIEEWVERHSKERF